MVEMLAANWLVYAWLGIKIVITTLIVLGWLPRIGWKHLRKQFGILPAIPLTVLMAILPIIGIPLVLSIQWIRSKL